MDISRVRILAVSVALLAARYARAGDLCFDSAGAMIVAVGHKIPGAGKCKAWKGGHSNGSVVNGSTCTTSDGATVRVGYSVAGGNSFEMGELEIPLPGLVGGSAFYTTCSGGGGGCVAHSGSASASPCNPPKQPVL